MYEVDGEVPVVDELAKQVEGFEEYTEIKAAYIVHFETKIVLELNCDILAVPTVFTFIRLIHK